MPQNVWWVVSAWVLILGGVWVYAAAQLNRQKRLEKELDRVRESG
jgi:hypothetical protein